MPTCAGKPSAISIRRWTEIADNAHLIPALDTIFFEASGTKTFASAASRRAFRERWLGRYLAREPAWVYVAIDSAGIVAGYLVGSIDDPAQEGPREDIRCFENFPALTAEYPAHLHVNLAPPYRNRGLGAALLAAFAADAARAGAKGVHVITGAEARNVGFYERNGFHELARATYNGHRVVFLGRRLDAAETS